MTTQRSIVEAIVLAAAAALAFGALGSVLAPATASAQSTDRCNEQQEAQSDGKNYRTVIGPDGRKIFVIERAFVVCGKVPRPQVIYVLQQRSINYEWENLKQDFLPKVVDSVKKAPF
jgi:hypothetical protein